MSTRQKIAGLIKFSTKIILFFLLLNLSLFSNFIFAEEADKKADVYISEFMASNSSSFSDEYGDYNDWIEIYNPTDKPFDIGGLYISDEGDEPLKWQIPKGFPEITTVPPGGYCILWADGEPEEGPMHLNFKLSKSGESIIITAADKKTVIDRVDFPRQISDVSYGRTSDRFNDWKFFIPPTPNAPNNSKAFSSLNSASLYRFYLNNKALIYVITAFLLILSLLSIILLHVTVLLKQNKNHLETIFNNTQDAIFLVNVENKTFRYYRLNATYEKLTGLTTDQIRGKTPHQVIGKELGKKIEANYRRCVEQKKAVSYDEELEFQGKKLTWHTKLSPVIADGEVVQIVGVSRDITARKKMEMLLKRNEREYRSLFEESPIGLIKIDNTGKIIDVNKEMLNLLGSPGKEATLRLNVFELPQLKKAGLSHLYEPVIKEGRQVSGEVYYTSYWEKKLWLNYYVKPILDEDGKVAEVIIACKDIGEKKEAEGRIKYLTFHDSLTGLYNRAYFNEELKRYDTQRQLPLSIIVGDVNGLKMTNDIFGHIEGDKLLIMAARMIKESCRQEDLVARWGGDEFVILLPNTSGEEAEKVCARIKNAFKNIKAEPIKPEIALGCATKTEAVEDVYTVFRRAENLMYKNKLNESRSVQDAIISSLKKHLEKKTCETLSHCCRVKELALKLGGKLKLSDSQLKNLALLAELHDIGMVAVPEKILQKRGPLTTEEWEEVKTHPEMGYKIAVSFPELIGAAEGILSHHERWDGSGYPQGLKMEEIPLISRIIAITDAYDVMTHECFYKNAKNQKEAVEELKKGAGSQFDPEIVDVFINRVLNP